MKYLLMFFGFCCAHAQAGDLRSSIQISDNCQKWGDNYLIKFEVRNHPYSHLEIRFANKNDCADEMIKLNTATERQETTVCGCEARKYMPAAFNGESFYYGSMKCVYISQNNIIPSDSKNYVINNWSALSNVQQISAYIANYFDYNDSLGRNYELCKQSIDANRTKAN